MSTLQITIPDALTERMTNEEIRRFLEEQLQTFDTRQQTHHLARRILEQQRTEFLEQCKEFETKYRASFEEFDVLCAQEAAEGREEHFERADDRNAWQFAKDSATYLETQLRTLL